MSKTFKRVGVSPGIFRRGDRLYAGYRKDGRWTMKALDATSLNAAVKERAGLISDPGPAPSKDSVLDVLADWQGARRLSPRTEAHENDLARRHLPSLLERRVQDMGAGDVARVLRPMRDTYSPWTQVAVYRLLSGVFAHAHRRRLIAHNPVEGLAPTEKPKQSNAREVMGLDAKDLDTLVAGVPRPLRPYPSPYPKRDDP